MEKNRSLKIQKNKNSLNFFKSSFNFLNLLFLKEVFAFFVIVLNKFFTNIFLFFIGVYRTFGSQYLGGNCRFSPSCSHYANEAFHRYNFIFAFKLVLLRVLKCHPFGSYGYDPVPERKNDARAAK